MPVVLDLIDRLIVAIKRLKQVFGRVFLPCVAGNHGRFHKKKRAKESNYSSFDWLIYQSLDRHFQDDPDIIFFIPDGPDALVSVYGYRYLFTHGDQFRGGDGMIGALGPITRGDHKKRSRNAQIKQEYDTMVIGHFHQLIQQRRIIVNGSLCGYNEYAHINNFGYEPPQQALWIVNQKHGVTFSMPVHVDGDRERPEGQPWVSFFEAHKAA
jgi:predicted phosphodiesterase